MHYHTCTQFITFAYEILILVLYIEVGSNQFIPGGITLHNSLLKASKATDLYENGCQHCEQRVLENILH